MGEIVTQAQLIDRLAPSRGQSVIVTTNGCFDILHVGHLRYLQACKQMGNILVVAINSDASVRGLKGPERPIVSEDERAELLAGLGCVDYVVMFDEPTPENFLRAVRPDIHAKGAQYNEDNLPEAETLRSVGARIQFVPMIEGRSTTNIIERIRQIECR